MHSTLRILIVIAALLPCVLPAQAQTIFTGTFSASGTVTGGACTTPGPTTAAGSIAVTVQPTLSTLVSSGGTATGLWVANNITATGCGDWQPDSGAVTVTVAVGGATTLVLQDKRNRCPITLTGTTTSVGGSTNCDFTTGSLTFNLTALPANTTPGTLRVTPAALQFTAVAGGGVTPPQVVNILNDGAFQNNLSGTWSGTASDLSSNGFIEATFVQTGSSLTGALAVMDGPASFTGTLSGSVVGTSFSFVVTGIPDGSYSSGQANLNVNVINGSYFNVLPGRANTTGTFRLTRQSAAPGLVSALAWTVQASTVTGGSWLTVQPSSGASNVGNQGVPVTVTAQTTGLAPGQYTGQIQVSSAVAANSPLVVSVMLTVLPSATAVPAQVRPAGLIFAGGATAPSAQSVQISSASSSSVQATFAATTASGGNWLSIDKTSATVSSTSPVTLNVSVSNTLPSGVYQGQVAVNFTGGISQAIQVILAIPASTSAGFKLPTEAACTARRLLAVDRTVGSNFNSQLAWPTTLEVLVVDDCGVFNNVARVLATFSNGDAPQLLQSLGSGRYQGTWRPVNISNSVTVTVTVTQGQLQQGQVTVAGKTSDNPNVPAVNPGGMVGAANYGGNTLPPGGIIAIFGKNLAQSGAAANLPLPNNLGGVTLTAAGRDLPLFYTSSEQVNAQLPTELAAGTRVAVVAKVTVGGNAILAVPEIITIGPTAPGIFSVNQDGKGQGVIVDASNRLLDGTQASAAPGQVVVIYCSGLGATTPAVASGQAAPSNPLALVTPTPVVNIGGASAVVQFAGMTPGLVGLYQINVVVPAGVSGAAVPVSITHLGVTSNTVTMVVR